MGEKTCIGEVLDMQPLTAAVDEPPLAVRRSASASPGLVSKPVNPSIASSKTGSSTPP